MSLPNFIRIDRGSDGSPSPQTKQRDSFCLKTGENQYMYFEVCSSKLALMPASGYNCDVNESYVNVFAKFH